MVHNACVYPGCDLPAVGFIDVGETEVRRAWLCDEHKELLETGQLNIEWALMNLFRSTDED